MEKYNMLYTVVYEWFKNHNDVKDLIHICKLHIKICTKETWQNHTI